jgi:adenosylmethionine-8-amino-7-oxononanoate aminotransferase
MIMAPPFVTTPAEIDTLFEKLTAALDKTAGHYSVT